MRERLGHTVVHPAQFALRMGDRDPAVTGMLVITGVVREVMAGPGVWPRRPLSGPLDLNLDLAKA
jgi:hypothetical protein